MPFFLFRRYLQMVLYVQFLVGRHSQARYAIGRIGTSGLVGILLVGSFGHVFQLDSRRQGVQAIAPGSIDVHAGRSPRVGRVGCNRSHVSWFGNQDFVQWFAGYFVQYLVETL